VGNELAPVESLWSHFESVMGPREEEAKKGGEDEERGEKREGGEDAEGEEEDGGGEGK